MQGMSTTPRSVILTGVDSSKASIEVVKAAAQQAQRPGAELHIVHCLPLPLDAGQSTTQALEHGRELLENLAKEAVGVQRVVLHLAAGAPWLEIVQLSANLHADLIVVGTHDYSALKKLVLGSVAEQVVKKAACPVLVVRPADYHGKSAPEIEPACPDCLTTQRNTHGAQLWCERHSKRHAHGRLHFEFPEGFGSGSMNFKP
jgi:nucleotide-binding universal stress UspA family protein